MRFIVVGILAALALTACGTECMDDDCGDDCADGSCGGSGGTAGNAGQGGGAGVGGTAGQGGSGGQGAGGSGGTSGTDHQLCVAACEHLETCPNVVQVDVPRCIEQCDAGALSTREATCLAEMECTTQAYLHCVPMNPKPGCVAACGHVYEDCGLEFFLSDDSELTQWECEQLCSGSTNWSESQLECLAGIECTNDAKLACLQNG